MSKRITSVTVESEYIDVLKSHGVCISTLVNDYLGKQIGALIDGNKEDLDPIVTARSKVMEEKRAREARIAEYAALTPEERAAHMDKLLNTTEKQP